MTPASTTEAHACFVCKQPAEQRCSTCSNARYCSNACQKHDWKMHKMLCKSFANLEPRPGPAFFRGILFPADEPLPRFVWIEYGNMENFVSMRREPFFGSSILGHRSNDSRPNFKRVPPHRLGIYFSDSYMFENLLATPSLKKWLGPALGQYFRGHFLAHSYENGVKLDDGDESGIGRPCDIDTAALAILLGFFQSQGAAYHGIESFD
jgi:hypothetical protein